MKKKTKLIIIPALIVLLFLIYYLILYFFTPLDIQSINLEDLESKEFNLSKDDYLEDFDYTYDILEQYYPFFEVNKRLNNLDWLSNKQYYRNYIGQANSDEDFYYRMNEVLSELNNAHTSLVDPSLAIFNYISYYRTSRYDWRHDIAKIYEKENVRRRYKINTESINDFLEDNNMLMEENKSSFINFYDSRYAYNFSKDNNSYFGQNLRTRDLVDGQISYIKINQMLSLEEISEDEIILEKYLPSIKDYKGLVIDIRGNGGGDSRYWQEFFLPKIIGKSYSTRNYSFMKKGNLLKKIIAQENFQPNVENLLKDHNFPKESREIIKDFDYYNSYDYELYPKNSINFKGKIYLLVDENVYSSAEMLASFCKETGLATLVGSKTGGDGIGTDPMQVDLPNTGYVLRFSKNLGLTSSGSINELEKTEPDIFLDFIDLNNVSDSKIFLDSIKNSNF